MHSIIDWQHRVSTQSPHCNVKACLVLKKKGAKSGDDYFFGGMLASVLPGIAKAVLPAVISGISNAVGFLLFYFISFFFSVSKATHEILGHFIFIGHFRFVKFLNNTKKTPKLNCSGGQTSLTL